MLPALTLMLVCQCALGQQLADDIYSDLTDFDLDIAPRRIPRQVKALLTKEPKPHIQELSIKTTIISRYAFTAVSCTMLNRHSAAAEGVFQFHVPAAAYISNFTMIIGGRVYQSEVRPKQKKIRQDKDAKAQNKESGDSSVEVEAFRVAASIPGRNRAVFLLAYEELLQRRLGRYELVTSLRPLQLVSRLGLEVTVVDHGPIASLEVLPLGGAGGAGPNAAKAPAPARLEPPVTTVIQRDKNFCKVTFSPNIIQQAKISTSGNLGDFVIRYDVERELGIGDIQVLNGHFVHYFAPKDLPVVPKNVVFVIDTSASMVGTKIRQTKDALFTILSDLRHGDRFNLVSFNSRIKVWQPGQLVAVTPLNVRDAKKFVYTLPPTGGTNIDEAIQTGSALLRDYLSGPDAHPNTVSLIAFLTDGRPTAGEVKSPAILGNARAAVQEKFCVFTIGIGNDVDYRLLERMALENCGTMRRIREDQDASAMLKGFYDEIGTPLLSDIRINYTADAVQYVTQHVFPNYFNGSEIVIAGKLTNRSAESLHVQVTASNGDKSIVLETDVPLQRRQAETEVRAKAAAAGRPPGSGVTTGKSGVAAGGSGVAAGGSGVMTGKSGVTGGSGAAAGGSGVAGESGVTGGSGVAAGGVGVAGESGVTGELGVATGGSGVAGESEVTMGSGVAAGGSGVVAGGSGGVAGESMVVVGGAGGSEFTAAGSGVTGGSEFTGGSEAEKSPAEDFVGRLWGLLSVKDGLRGRLRSRTSAEREALVQQATNLSLEYHFLTPLTSLLLDTPQLLPDGTVAPATIPATTPAPSANELPDEEEGEEEASQSLPRGSQGSARLANTMGEVDKWPLKKPITISRTSADGDPHFVVEFPLSKLTVCFNINGEPGHVLRLVSDHKYSGVTVNGKLIGAPAPPGSHKQQRTYFSAITIVADRPGRAYIEVTPRKVILDGHDRLVLPCDATATVESGALTVAIAARSNVTVTIGAAIAFVILMHQYKNPAPYQRDHLGFYISNSKGLSHNCHGLLGQFLYEEVGLASLPVPAEGSLRGDIKASPVLKVKGRSVPVVQKTRRIYKGAQSVDCWFARNNAAKLIDGRYEDYVAAHMFDTGERPSGNSMA